jgi:hypothetical protein
MDRWTGYIFFLLTPALSRGERENCAPSLGLAATEFDKPACADRAADAGCSLSPVRVQRCSVFLSLSSPEGGEGRGEEAASTSDLRTPPSPTLPPLVPRGERETFVEYAKHIISPREKVRVRETTVQQPTACRISSGLFTRLRRLI